MKIPCLKRIGKGLLSFVFIGTIFASVFYGLPGVYRKATTGSWTAPPPVVDPSLCYSGHGVLIYDHDRFRPPDKCPAKMPPYQSERSE
jgi:hypothetical protein